MFCGKRSFSPITDDDSPTLVSTKSCKLKPSMSASKKEKRSGSLNPYSSAGREKFESILTELESKKEKIKLTAKSQGGAMVRFTYKPDSEDWIPIVIKSRAKQPKEEETTTKKAISAPPSIKVEEKGKMKSYSGVSYGWGVSYWGLMIVLVLVLLMFGRSFAICWTTMCLYLVPMMKVGRERKDKSLKKGLRKR